MKPELSIIVPVYNASAFLHECIESILAQTFTNFELIIVDDGSTDDSGKICDEFEKKDNRIRVIHKENGGVVSARKAGIQAAVGKYAGYVDGDDRISPDMYGKMVEYMKKYDCDIVMCDVEHESRHLPFSSGGTCTDLQGGFYDRKSLENEILPKMIYSGEFFKFGIYPVIWNKLYKREKLIQHQMAVDERITTGEDAACVYPYMLEADSMYFIKNMSLYHYRHSGNQMTVTYNASCFEHFRYLYEFLSKSQIASSSYADQLDYYYAYSIKTVIANEVKKENPAPFLQKLRNIKEFSSFAVNEGFIDRLNTSDFPLRHRVYFSLLAKNRPLPLVIGIRLTRLIQKIFR